VANELLESTDQRAPRAIASDSSSSLGQGRVLD